AAGIVACLHQRFNAIGRKNKSSCKRSKRIGERIEIKDGDIRTAIAIARKRRESRGYLGDSVCRPHGRSTGGSELRNLSNLRGGQNIRTAGTQQATVQRNPTRLNSSSRKQGRTKRWRCSSSESIQSLKKDCILGEGESVGGATSKSNR